MREFLITYPDWQKWGVEPSKGWLIGADWFDSPSASEQQLALQMTGSSIITSGEDRTRQTDIRGVCSVTRQINFMLFVLRYSGLSTQRSDTNEFLFDFIEWIDLKDIRRETPVFGDEPLAERLWATNGGFVSEWQGEAKGGMKAHVYAIQIHKTYTKNYEPIFK